MKTNKITLLACIAVPLLAGVLAGTLARGGMQTYAVLEQPPFAPPGWVFPAVWTILYILMGSASYLIIVSEAEPQQIADALAVYAYQLVVNFLWPVFFFDFGWYLFAFFWLILLWVLILATIRQFAPISKLAAWLMIPYLLWVTFAGYLNLGIWWLN